VTVVRMLTKEVRTRVLEDEHTGGKPSVARMAIVVATGIVVLGSGPGITRAAADNSVCAAVGEYCGLYSPSGRIDCEINTGGRTGPDSVYCKTVEPPQSVHLDNTGIFQACTGQSCLGDAAQGLPTLAYGQTMALDPFRCLSEVAGVTCTAAGGRGFTISTRGIATAG
jgi:hypothetical protein